MDKNKIYQSLFNAYMEAYPTKSKKVCQEELVQKWNNIKNDADLQGKVDCWLQELKATSIIKKGSLLTFWAKQATSANMNNPINVSVKIPKTSVSQSDEQVIGAEADDSEPNNLPTSRIATAQLHLQSQIDVLNYDLVCLYEQRNRKMLTQKQDVELKDKKKKRDELENKLKKQKGDQNRAQKARDETKKKMKALLEENPELLTTEC